MNGFRYLLALENVEPADPAAFVRLSRLADRRHASNGWLFRVLGIKPEVEPASWGRIP